MTTPRTSLDRPRLKTFDDVLAHLNGRGLFHMDMGLGRMERALQGLGIRRFPCPAVQVVGTNGKGSTTAFLYALGRAHGFRTGMFTSPHFLSPSERLAVNGLPLPPAAWPDFANRALSVEPDLTYFELVTVIAALAFCDAEPDLLIFEAGLGGRHDATSALPLDMVCFTPIDLDHQHLLGNDVLSIAADKADALRPGIRAAVTARQRDDVLELLRQKAEAADVPLHEVALEGKKFPAGSVLGLHGPHQSENAATAWLAWRTLCKLQKWNTNDSAVRRGLQSAFLPGRLQSVPAQGGYPEFLLDGAHNTHGMTALLAAVRELPVPPSLVIFSCLGDKNPEALSAILGRIAGEAPILTPTIAHNERAFPGETLAALLGPSARAVPSLAEALDGLCVPRPGDESIRRHGNGPVLICGSLYLLAEFFSLFPRALRPPED